MPCKEQSRSGRYFNNKISRYYQYLLSFFRFCVCGIHSLFTVIKYWCKLYKSMPFHHCRYIITDDIVSRCQCDGTAIAKRYILGYIRYLNFKRKTGTLRHNQFLTRKRRKYAVLRIAGRPRRHRVLLLAPLVRWLPEAPELL